MSMRATAGTRLLDEITERQGGRPYSHHECIPRGTDGKTGRAGYKAKKRDSGVAAVCLQYAIS